MGVDDKVSYKLITVQKATRCVPAKNIKEFPRFQLIRSSFDRKFVSLGKTFFCFSTFLQTFFCRRFFPLLSRCPPFSWLESSCNCRSDCKFTVAKLTIWLVKQFECIFNRRVLHMFSKNSLCFCLSI